MFGAWRSAMFVIISDSTVIGWTKFEYGDAPMGVALGKFIPAEAFAEFVSGTPVSSQSNERVRVWSDLRAMSPDGVALEGATVSVALVERSSVESEADISVAAEAIPYPLYSEVFPHHVADYSSRFPDDA
jgi:hypothetical protein